MKVKITCQNCGSAFELTSQHTPCGKEYLRCPNCNALFPLDAYKDLLHIFQDYAELQKHLTAEDDLGTEHPFQVNFF